ncbi:MAG: ATP-binding protein [Verrucomicrobia bacterium]|nr:ATP-binding protein [Verrucomicrobiota bacterium]
MLNTRSDLLGVLRQFNPWWRGERQSGLPDWKRAAFGELKQWVRNPPAPRAVLLSGARQIGKTTLLLQTIESLLAEGVPPGQILYATFDHPLLKLAGLDGLMDLWREVEPAQPGPEFVFLDEIQYTKDWQTWLKHQVDFQKHRRIAVTGSATPLVTEGQESGTGRWHTVRLATLSFYEYLQIKKVPAPDLPEVGSLQKLRSWSTADFGRTAEAAKPLTGHFHDYLLRGGFPQCALVDGVVAAQKLLREDIVDKVLKRDMTALYGVRRVLELEQTFLYLCLHDGGLLDMADLGKNLQVKKPTATNYIALLEAAHLIHRLMPFGYGKEILRGRSKVYLADAAIAPSVLLKGKSMLEDAAAMGAAVETAFFKHIFTRYYQQSVGFSYWRGKKDQEVDIIAGVEGRLVPFEVKYRNQATGWAELKGMVEFCRERMVSLGYVITREAGDFGIMERELEPGVTLQLLKIPAPLACYWLGKSEITAQSP